MPLFSLHSKYQPTGDQPQAIDALADGLARGFSRQTLKGVTGSGKTFTMANVIARANRPALIISHNKTLAAQLYAEFKEFFPDNAVEVRIRNRPTIPLQSKWCRFCRCRPWRRRHL